MRGSWTLQGGSVVQSRVGQEERRGGDARAQLMASIGHGMLGFLQPLLLGSVAAERDRLARAGEDAAAAQAQVVEDLANLNIIINGITAYERRWRSRLDRILQAWPRPPAGPQASFSLVSDDELQGQLVGQPVIDALERRHADILDTLEKRLWTLAAQLGAEQAPENPFSPRHLVDGLLETLTPADCGPALRATLLRRFEQLGAVRLGEAYDWCNRQLAEAGIGLASTADYATLAATTIAAQRPAPPPARLQVWGPDNAVAPVRSSWRGVEEGTRAAGAVRGAMLRHAARARRARSGPRPAGARELRDEEFLAAVSLLQVDPAPLPGAGAGSAAAAARQALLGAAASLGIDSASATPSAEQEDAIDVVGGLFDALVAGHLLQPGARDSLAALLLPYLRLALLEPRMFEPAQPPAMQLLARLVQLWDGNGRASEHETRLHELADATAREIVADFHGDAGAFANALVRLEDALAPLSRRADLAARRAWQAIEGGERLDAARAAAARELAVRLEGRELLPAVTAFLTGHWQQSLVQAWLRAGPESPRFAEAAALGDAVVRLDAAARAGEGGTVASTLIGLQPRLQACCQANGVDGTAADAEIARLVADLAQPDAPRHPYVPAGTPGAPAGNGGGAGGIAGELEPGRRLVQNPSGGPPRALTLAWRSPLTGALLLVNAQGSRELLLRPPELAAMLADGRLVLRPPGDPVEAALQGLERAWAAPGPGGSG